MPRMAKVSTTVQTDWVSPADAITGQDHLAVQAVSEHLYATLLPGLTNGTARIRCYAFYPWFVWAFDRRSKKKTAEELVRVFRMAECLHTLIGIVHELDTEDAWSHGSNLIGRERLVGVARRLVAGETIRLSDYTSLESSERRYFAHKLGGLGQYYLGPLKTLQVLDGGARDGLRCTAEWGVTLASAYDARVDAKKFFAVLDHDRVDAATIHSLFSFCPCHLQGNGVERDALVTLLFRRGDGELKAEGGEEGRQTLTLLLHHVRALQASGSVHPDPAEFLASCYTGVLPDDVPWSTPASFAAVRDGWGIYQRHELLAIAVQGLFWAGLRTLQEEKHSYVEDALSYVQWFSARFRGVMGAAFASTGFASLVEERRRTQPAHADWREAAEHELNVGAALLDAQRDEDVDKVVERSLGLLLSLVARGIGEAPYGELIVADRFFQNYEINLFALRRYAADTWPTLNGVQWLEWLAGSWALRVHFRVALRKLRYQSKDTFRIVPREDGYHVIGAPPAQWTNPRLTQALRFLHDLGALNLNEDLDERPYVLSPFGARLLERELGGQ
jgi:hypothetical protein